MYIAHWQSFRAYHWEEQFLATIFPKEKDACICPICESAPRQRIEANWIEANWIDSNKRVLLWAPENSLLTFFAQAEVELITADYYKQGVNRQENIEASNFADGEFDLIICNHVLEHVAQVKEAIADTYRILNNGGTALFMVPLDSALEKTKEKIGLTKEERKELYGQADHLRLFGKDIKDLFQQAGFIVECYQGERDCPKEIRPITGPSEYDSSLLFICNKNRTVL